MAKTPKTKQRWTAAQKAERRSTPKGAGKSSLKGAPKGGTRGGPKGSARRLGRSAEPRRTDDGGWSPRRPQGERPARDERRERDHRPGRDDRSTDRPRRDRDDRGYSSERGERGNRYERGTAEGDRSQRYGRPERGDRAERGDRSGWQPRRDDRAGDGRRADRPRYNRDSQGERDRPTRGRTAEGRGYEGRGYEARGSEGRDNAGRHEGRGRDRRDFDGPRREDRERPRRDSWAKHPETEHHRFTRAEQTPSTPPPAPVTPPVVHEGAPFADLGLPQELVQALADQGIVNAFPIQAATIPDALSGKDVLGRGQTGSGKTFAFGLPALARLAQGGRARPNRPRALVLVPTRELAMQVADGLAPLVKAVGLHHKLVAGGMPYGPQFAALERGVDLLIATPGRMIDLMERGNAKLDAIEVVVLDEADHMAEMGFLPEVTTLLDEVPEGGQRLLFSATLDRGVDTLVERYLTDPVTHSTDAPAASVTTMDHHILLVEPQHKKPLTAELANRPGRTVVFVRTQLGADRVAEQLREVGVTAAPLHGGLGQGIRTRTLAAFKEGKVPVLVATDVAARGIHVDDVGLVLQADPPADHKDYLHRAGRTARAGQQGIVVTIALPHQKATMRRLAREAGIEAAPIRTAPGDSELLEATGGSDPSGIPLPDNEFQKLLEGEQKGRRRGGPPRRGGPGRPRGRSFDRPRRPRD